MSAKRVLSWSYINTQNNPDAINAVNFSSPMSAVYNWEAWTPPELNGRLPFQPMCHGKERIDCKDPNWLNVKQNASDLTIHFLNEPERANTTPEQAVDLWREHMLPLRMRNNKLVSPACASDDAGITWISQFLGLIGPDERPDITGAHWYGESADEMRAYLSRLHGLQPDSPVIVTEWACTSRDYQKVLTFTVDACNWLDLTDWIYQHALFGATPTPVDDFVSPAAQLMNPDGSFTDLMYKYMYDLPMHT